MPSFDREKFANGTVPWSADECTGVMEWYHKTLNTPKDDWNLQDLGINLRNDDGSVSRLSFNMFHPMNQLGTYMVERYGTGTAPYHIHRFMLIMDFLSDYHQRLTNDGLARAGREDHAEIRGEVLEALCVLPFSRIETSDSGGELHTFDYDELVTKAREFMNDCD